MSGSPIDRWTPATYDGVARRARAALANRTPMSLAEIDLLARLYEVADRVVVAIPRWRLAVRADGSTVRLEGADVAPARALVRAGLAAPRVDEEWIHLCRTSPGGRAYADLADVIVTIPSESRTERRERLAAIRAHYAEAEVAP